jgi:GT2 family glycosyltransferase
MRDQPTKIISLASCYNRRSCTIAALQSLSGQSGLANAFLDHLVVDDFSSDGTRKAIKKHFPNVQVITGNGKLFWAGGMRYGWEWIASNTDFDYLFVYNDDAILNSNALSRLLQVAQNWPDQNHPLAVVGTVVDPSTGKPSYGGRRTSSRWHPLKFANLIEPNGEVQQADVFNMNAALISRSALDRIGFLAPYFVHSGADYEFGLRLRQAGGVILVAPDVVGTCRPNPISDSSHSLPRSISGRLQYLLDPKREPPRQRWEMYRRHGGPFWLLLFLVPYISIWLPRGRK